MYIIYKYIRIGESVQKYITDRNVQSKKLGDHCPTYPMDRDSPSEGEVKELIPKLWDEQLLKFPLNLKYLSDIKYKNFISSS